MYVYKLHIYHMLPVESQKFCNKSCASFVGCFFCFKIIKIIGGH